MKKLLSIFVILFAFVGCASVEGDWNKAQRLNNVYSYKHFLAEHSDSEYAQQAAEKLETATWDQAKQLDKPDLYQHYISNYPNGFHVAEAKANIEPSAFRQAKNQAVGQETPVPLEQFLEKYPETEFKGEAEAQIVQLRNIHKIEREFKTQFETLLSQSDYEEIENLIDAYTQYKFVGKFIPRLEEKIFNEIKVNGVKDRYFVPIAINQGAPFFKVTFRAHYWGEGNKWSLEAGASYPGDTSGMNAILNGSNPGNGSIIRYGRSQNLSGVFLPISIEVKGYKFLGKGDENHLLTFGVLKDVGYVYLRGIGSVQGPDNKSAILGR